MLEEFLKYKEALDIEIEEVKKRSREQSITVHDGEKIDEHAGGQILYQFYYKDQFRKISDDIPAIIQVGSEIIDGFLVSFIDNKLIISLDKDIGKKINTAFITIDESELLKRLKKSIEEIINGNKEFNHETVEKVFFKKESKIGVSSQININIKELNEEQKKTLQIANGSDCTYIWGPPGTGKTTVLARIIESNYKKGKRILAVSNTNIAVDVLLLNLSENLKKESDKGFLNGKVLRYGNLVDEKLRRKYEDYVDPEAIAERLATEFKKKKTEIEKEKEKLLKKIEPFKKILESFKKVDGAKNAVTNIENEIKESLEEIKEKESYIVDCYKIIREYKREIEDFEDKNIISKFLSTKPEDIQVEIGDVEERIKDHKSDIKELETKALEKKPELKKKKFELKEVTELIKVKDRKKITLEYDKLLEKISKIENELSELEQKINKIKNEVIKNCQVLFMSSTFAHLHSKDFGFDFDLAIVDEASMLIQPVMAYIAGMSKNKIVVAGDFRQLPPIVIAEKEELVKSNIKRNIFDKANIEKKIKNKNQCPKNIYQLRKQYRMKKKICNVINKFFYSDYPLVTVNGSMEKNEKNCPNYLRKNNLFLVDTGKLAPFSNYRPKSWSRYNIINALCARNICFDLFSNKFINSLDDVGVITPYSAQQNYLSTLCSEINLNNVITGTVHRYQGTEKKIIIFDTTDSYGTRLGGFYSNYGHSDDGKKLLNVALSRAKEKIVLIANLDYFENKQKYLSNTFGGIINFFKKEANIIDAEKILKLFPSNILDIPVIKSKKGFKFDKSKSSFFDQKDFDEQFIYDIKKAKKNIIIFSGFITTKRIAYLSDFFREKIKKGVRITIFTRFPEQQGNIGNKDSLDALKNLKKLGVKINLRGQQHEKVILIDDDIFWIGSINPLSTNLKSKEIMLRTISKDLVHQKSKNEIYKSGVKKDEDIVSTLVNSNNPKCKKEVNGKICGADTFLLFRRKDRMPFVKCTECKSFDNYDKPSWVGRKYDKIPEDIKSKEEQKKELDEIMSNKTLVNCPECGRGKIIPQWSYKKYGYFLSCDQYRLKTCKWADNLKNINKYFIDINYVKKPKDDKCLLNQLLPHEILPHTKCLSTKLPYKDCCGKN